jgi:hypothetical protein
MWETRLDKTFAATSRSPGLRRIGGFPTTSHPGFLRLALVALLCVGVNNCDLIHDRTLEYGSPDGKSRLTIATVGIKPQIRVRLRSNNAEKLVYEDAYPPREFYIRFAEVYWTPDSKQVASFIVSGDSAPLILAFDVSSQSRIDPHYFQEKLAQKIRDDYSVAIPPTKDPTFDPMLWAATRQEAFDAFEQKQGKISLR